jgi:hypothetical protein
MGMRTVPHELGGSLENGAARLLTTPPLLFERRHQPGQLLSQGLHFLS